MRSVGVIRSSSALLAEREEGSPFESTLSGDLLLRVLAKPKASKSRVVGPKEGELVVQVAAPPVDGAANEELILFLARVLGLGRGRVVLVKGETSRHKTIRLIGVSREQAEQVLVSSR